MYIKFTEKAFPDRKYIKKIVGGSMEGDVIPHKVIFCEVSYKFYQFRSTSNQLFLYIKNMYALFPINNALLVILK